MPVLKLLKMVGGTSLGCFGILLVILLIWAISALVWGSILGLLVWNTLGLHTLFHAGTLTFAQSLGVGAVASFVLG